MDWYSMNSNQSVYELHETSLNLRPGDLPWSVKMQYGNWNIKDYVTPSGELAVEEAMELLWDRLRNDGDDYDYDGNENVHNVTGLGWREHISGRGCN